MNTLISYESYTTKPIEDLLKESIQDVTFLRLSNYYFAVCEKLGELIKSGDKRLTVLRNLYNELSKQFQTYGFSLDAVHAYRLFMDSPNRHSIAERLNIPKDNFSSITEQYTARKVALD